MARGPSEPVGRGASAGVTSGRMSPAGPGSQFRRARRPVVVPVALVDVPAAPRTLRRIGRNGAPEPGAENRDHGAILARHPTGMWIAPLKGVHRLGREALMRTRPGSPSPLGATWDGAGVNFALFSENADGVELCL